MIWLKNCSTRCYILVVYNIFRRSTNFRTQIFRGPNRVRFPNDVSIVRSRCTSRSDKSHAIKSPAANELYTHNTHIIMCTNESGESPKDSCNVFHIRWFLIVETISIIYNIIRLLQVSSLKVVTQKSSNPTWLKNLYFAIRVWNRFWIIHSYSVQYISRTRMQRILCIIPSYINTSFYVSMKKNPLPNFSRELYNIIYYCLPHVTYFVSTDKTRIVIVKHQTNITFSYSFCFLPRF